MTIIPKATTSEAIIRLMKTDLGASCSCLRSYINQLSLELRLRFATVTSSRTTHPQRQRDDLKRRRQPAHYFAIKFDSDDFIFFQWSRGDLFGQRVRHFIHAQVRAEIQPGRVAENSKRAGIADTNYIKKTVIKFGVGGDLHRATVVARVGNAKLGHAHAPLRFLAQLNMNFDR